jgi:hypothetical protein
VRIAGLVVLLIVVSKVPASFAQAIEFIKAAGVTGCENIPMASRILIL